MQHLLSAKHFYPWAGKLLPWMASASFVLILLGLISGLYLAPADYQQGDAFRIIYVHVPCAVLSLAIYVAMSTAAFIHLVWHIKLADVWAKVLAPQGALFTFLALCTGALWGKPMWGTWWIWDARLTSELILFFIYLAIIGIRQSLPDQMLAARASAVFTLVGLVDIPIIHYSVYWWNTLHQPATLLKFAKPTIAPSMLYPLIFMLLGFFAYLFSVFLLASRQEILLRQQNQTWLNELK